MLMTWVKVRAGLLCILHHAVGEMPGRAEGVHARGGVLAHHNLGYKRTLLESTPLLVASSSRSSAVASGGQESGALSLHKPWIEAHGRVAAPPGDDGRGQKVPHPVRPLTPSASFVGTSP